MSDRSDKELKGLRAFGAGVRYRLAGREFYVDSRRVWKVLDGHSRTGKSHPKATGRDSSFTVRANDKR